MNKKDTCIDIKEIRELDIDSLGEVQIFHNLMPFKVREILLVSSLYDAFIVEEEGLISEMVIDEYRHLLLSSPPRVTHVKSSKEALRKIKSNKYDLIISMSKNIGMDPYIFSKKVKKECPNLPIIVLATDTNDLRICQKHVMSKSIDKAFFWNGDSSLFMAIVKYVEDKLNVKYDIANGNVQVIILIEDSIRDYSRLLPIIYSEIVQQAQRCISDDFNEMQRLLRRRARPKILLTDNYEEGIKLYNKYKENILGIISDVKFFRENKIDPKAGNDFIKYVNKSNPYIPTLLQSTNPKNRKPAEELGAYFINKNSPSILLDFNKFLLKNLGFGDFVFLMKKDKTDSKDDKDIIEIDRAANLIEFEKKLKKVPLESIRYHANRNDFSNWLMARGEFKLAKKLRPQKISDFRTIEENRKYLVKIFNQYRKERQLGVISEISQQKFEFDSSYTKIGGESLGGKGRGIAFIRTLLSRYNLNEKYPDVDIIVPNTVAIGTDEFDKFLTENELTESISQNEDISDAEICKKFLRADLSKDLIKKLKIVLKNFKKPLAVRSSSLLEDSQNHPFAGIYSTYMIPNNSKNEKNRLKQLGQAIKLVYASTYFRNARTYISSTSAKSQEEKMAVIIQEIIGEEHFGKYYPTFSGVAQSYNYYPISHQKRNEGIVNLAAGLGYSVVGGEKVFRFSPKYPEINPEFSTPQSIFENTQNELYVLNTNKSNMNLSGEEFETLKKINVSEISEDGTLEYITSTYDREDGMIRDSFSKEGPYLLTFAGVIKHNLFPLTKIIDDLLNIGQESMGAPVEIEFAVNVSGKEGKRPLFAIIQIRPLIISQENQKIEWDEKETKGENVLLHSKISLGNGEINDVKDIVYVMPKNFDSSETLRIAKEINSINKTLEGKPYLLIGPGRWGTQDRWLGVPVIWNEISNVKIMVETSFKEFDIKPTQGTHFFQNLISKGVGYVHVPKDKNKGFIDWSWIEKQKEYKKYDFVKHIKLDEALIIKLNGKNGEALFLKSNK